MKIKLPPGIIVKSATLVTAIWLGLSLIDISGYDTSARGKLDLLGFAVIGAIVINGIGIVLQEFYDWHLARQGGRRRDD